MDNFELKVVKTNSCWNWSGCVIKNGYGQITIRNKVQYAHRVAYERAKGEIPKGLCVDHLCRNRSCVNPDHLEVVTSKENTLRGGGISAKNAVKRLCVNGHAFTKENTYFVKKGRHCKRCTLERTKKYRKKV